MGEVFDSLQVLNRTMKLGLSGKQLLAAEMKFKSEIAERAWPTADPIAVAEEYELFVTLKRRPQKLPLSELSRMAIEAVAKPAEKATDRKFDQIDNALKSQGGSKSEKT